MNGGMRMSDIRYFAHYDECGQLTSVGTVNTSGEVFGEITTEEYQALYAEIMANAPEPKPETMSDIDEALAILSGEVVE